MKDTKKKSRSTKKTNQSSKLKWIHILPLMAILFFVPLIVYLNVVSLEGIRYESWTGVKQSYDFFSYYKMVYFIIFTVAAIIFYMFKPHGEEYKIVKTYAYIPIVLYAVTIIISTMLSEYKEIALYGFIERYEGAFVLIGYLIVLVITMNLVKREEQIELLIKVLFASALIICIIGIFQYLGYDLFKSSFGKDLILPGKYSSIKNSLKFVDGRHIMYTTLYHNDYVGSYMAIVFPLAFTISILMSDKKKKVYMSIFTFIVFLVWIGCNSRAGIVGGMVSLLVLLIFIRKKIFKKWTHYLVTITVLLVCIVSVNIITKGKIINGINKLAYEAKVLLTNTNIDIEKTKDYPLKDIKIDSNKIIIVTKENTLNIELKENNIIYKDGSGENIEFIKGDSGKVILQRGYDNYNIKVGKNNSTVILQLSKDNYSFNFGIINNEFKLIDNKGIPREIKTVEKLGFEGKETIGSSRGYIWSRTLPLIKNKPLFGYGPDTFTLYFPQYDIMGKYNNYQGRMWEIIDKPHNLYLQMAVSTGILSLLAFLALMVMYAVASIKTYYKNEFKDINSIVGVGIFVALMGYLVTGLFNDSVVAVAPVFWVLLGVGISIN